MFRLIDPVPFTLERLNQHRILAIWVLVRLSGESGRYSVVVLYGRLRRTDLSNLSSG
jgi:hypothetical protein